MERIIIEETVTKEQVISLVETALKNKSKIIIETENKKEAIKELLNWTPEGVDLKAIGKINYPEKWYPKKDYGELVTDEDCKCPFFCESYLYPLLGKMDARTLLCLLQRAFESVGINIDDYGRWLESRENPVRFITPENSPTLKLLRQLRKEER